MMQVVCEQCRQVLEYSGQPPAFCAYCGTKLTLKVESAGTKEIDREAATMPPPAPRAEASTLLEPASASAGPAPQTIGDYRLLRPLGSGGMGSVHEAEQISTGQRVALKLIAPEFVKSEDAVRRFRQEGRLASGISHERCVFVLSADEEGGRPYIVMELMPGATLKDLVDKEGPLPVERAVALILDVIDGLKEAHRLGVVHRDVKPSNCFLDADGRVKVGDFGLSKSLTGDSHLTKSGAFLGTPLYSSPEQIKGEGVDAQSDVYSVAATLCFALTGRAPFQSGDSMATMARIVSEDAPSMRKLRPELPLALDAVVLRGLERDRKHRYRNLDEFREALRPFLPGSLSIGGVGMRVAAYVLDFIVTMPLFAAAGIFAAGHQQSPWRLLVITEFIPRTLVFLYYGITEGLWGCSLGKWLLRLRVCPVHGNQAPGLWRACVRMFFFQALLRWGHTLGGIYVAFHLPQNPDEVEPSTELAVVTFLLQWGWAFVGLVLMVSTMRARNGYRGLHEFLSGTRVIQLPWPQRRRRLRRRGVSPMVQRPPSAPERLGTFTITGAVPGHPDTLLGEDSTLGRKVWIQVRPPALKSVSAGDRHVRRGTRIRWLTGGTSGENQWEAFLAPTGCPLPELVAQVGRLSWAELRPIIEGLATELAASVRDGTLPGQLHPDQVWVDDGRVQLVVLDPAPPEKGLADNSRALGMLRQVVILALEGKPRAPSSGPAPIRAPLPLHVTHMLDRLLRVEGEYRTVDELLGDLAASRDRPVEVTRGLRAGHLAVSACFLAPGLVLASFAAITVPAFQTAAKVQDKLQKEQAAESKPSDEKAADSAEAYFDLSSVEAAQVGWGMFAASAVIPLLWIVWAGLFRGGLSYKIIGLALVRRDGRPCSRLRCVFRALVVWTPLLLLLSSMGWLPMLGVSGPDANLHIDWVIIFALCILAVAALMLLYLLLALIMPRRGVHDWLAGTHIVPS